MPSLDGCIAEIQSAFSQKTLAARLSCVQEILHAHLQKDTFSFLEDFAPGKEGYGRYLLHEDLEKNFTFLLCVWGEGQWSALHDHGTSGVVTVAKGSILEIGFAEDPCVTKTPSCRVLRAGESTEIRPVAQDLHIMGNPSPEPAMTLHLYAAAGQRLAMRKFSLNHPHCTPLRLRLAEALAV